jgi:hypothetical protein
MPNFADIAAKRVDEVEQPPLPPVGTYRFRITKLPEVSKSQDEAWEFMRVPCKVVEALDNVDLEGYAGDPQNILMSVSFVFNTQDEVAFEQTEWRMRQFFEKHVQCVEPDMTVAQMMNASVNGEFLGTIKWKQDKRDASGETMQAEIAGTAPVE